MKKYLYVLILAASALALPLAATVPQTPQERFDATIKHVDLNGEMLMYYDPVEFYDLLEQNIPVFIQKCFANTPAGAAPAKSICGFVLRMINLKAFQTSACSSVRRQPDVYVLKSFTLIDFSRTSLLINPNIVNRKLDWQDLPADTRMALKGTVDMGYLWDTLYNGIKNDPDPQISGFAQQIDAFLAAQQVNWKELANSFKGDFELLVTGTSMEDFAFKVVFPDQNGSISKLMKQTFAAQTQNDVSVFPTPIGNVTIAYTTGMITIYSNAKLLQKPAATLGSLPRYQQYAKYLPADANSYFIIDIPQELIDLLKAKLQDIPKVPECIDILLSPVSAVCTAGKTADGFNYVAASNFSIAQLGQIMQSAWTVMPFLAGIGAAASTEAKSKSARMNCVNNLKQFGLACMIYADSHDGKLPKDIDTLLKDKVIDNDHCSNIIYLAGNLEYGKIKNPSRSPIAICDRCSHNEDKVCILFADGHVESTDVPEEADDDKVLILLQKQYGFDQEYLKFIQTQLAKEEE